VRYVRFFVSAPIAVSVTGDHEAWVSCTFNGDYFLDHSIRRTEKKDWPLMLRCSSENLVHEINPGNALRHGLPEQTTCPDYRHAVGIDDIARTDRLG